MNRLIFIALLFGSFSLSAVTPAQIRNGILALSEATRESELGRSMNYLDYYQAQDPQLVKQISTEELKKFIEAGPPFRTEVRRGRREKIRLETFPHEVVCTLLNLGAGFEEALKQFDKNNWQIGRNDFGDELEWLFVQAQADNQKLEDRLRAAWQSRLNQREVLLSEMNGIYGAGAGGSAGGAARRFFTIAEMGQRFSRQIVFTWIARSRVVNPAEIKFFVDKLSNENRSRAFVRAAERRDGVLLEILGETDLDDAQRKSVMGDLNGMLGEITSPASGVSGWEHRVDAITRVVATLVSLLDAEQIKNYPSIKFTLEMFPVSHKEKNFSILQRYHELSWLLLQAGVVDDNYGTVTDEMRTLLRAKRQQLSADYEKSFWVNEDPLLPKPLVKLALFLASQPPLKLYSLEEARTRFGGAGGSLGAGATN